MITQDELKSILYYSPETGVFTWIKSSSSKMKIGYVAGASHGRGYIQITINRKKYLAHRLAWLYVYGLLPNKFIDHIDGDTSNNSLKNLREASHAENMKNRIRQKNNTSGHRGVCWHKNTQKWMAQCKIDGKQKYLGLYDTPEAASSAYELFAKAKFGDFYKEPAMD